MYHTRVSAVLPQASLQPVPMLDFARQFAQLRDELMPVIEAVCASQRFILGPEVASFEAAAAHACHVSHAVGCASGTDALWLALAPPPASVFPPASPSPAAASSPRPSASSPPPAPSSAPAPGPSSPTSTPSPSISRPRRPRAARTPSAPPFQSHPARPPLRPVRGLGRF